MHERLHPILLEDFAIRVQLNGPLLHGFEGYRRLVWTKSSGLRERVVSDTVSRIVISTGRQASPTGCAATGAAPSSAPTSGTNLCVFHPHDLKSFELLLQIGARSARARMRARHC